MAVTSAERAYRAAVAKHLGAVKADEAAMFRAIREQLATYRDRILASLPAETAAQIASRETVRRGLADALSQLDARLEQQFNAEATKRTALALAGVDGPLEAIGQAVKHVPFSLPVRHLALINAVAPSLIRDVTTQVHSAVQQIMNRVLMGGVPPNDARKLISALLPAGGDLKPGQIIPRAEVRARTIFRTEMNRVGSLVTEQRGTQLAERDPNVGLKWLHFPSNDPRENHAALHGEIIYPARGEYFKVAGISVRSPHATELPAKEVVSCHCKVVVTYRKVGNEDPAAGISAVRVAVGV